MIHFPANIHVKRILCLHKCSYIMLMIYKTFGDHLLSKELRLKHICWKTYGAGVCIWGGLTYNYVMLHLFELVESFQS